jgi:hypothetical protein
MIDIFAGSALRFCCCAGVSKLFHYSLVLQVCQNIILYTEPTFTNKC